MISRIELGKVSEDRNHHVPELSHGENSVSSFTAKASNPPTFSVTIPSISSVGLTVTPEERVTLFTADGMVQIGDSMIPKLVTSSNKKQGKSKTTQRFTRFQESDYMDPNQGLCLGSLFDIATTNGLDMGRRLCIFGFCRSIEMLSDEELPVNGARLSGVDASSQILLMARRLPGIAGTHLLTNISLIHPHESEDILLPSSTKAIKDLHFSPFNHSLALFASLGKKLSVLSMESDNVILDYDLPVKFQSITCGVTD
ncbi:hypothetical protein EZV62_025854 [Acer yangbiense]|uniref:DUF7811 domain-containing protein n=1 Tax=Acer yangbiense TaxID=1000413 RepID=A0A5C7GZL2_9ROSI|nr:hypothetical protein EZV62_025854 [Acer yangbiense]